VSVASGDTSYEIPRRSGCRRRIGATRHRELVTLVVKDKRRNVGIVVRVDPRSQAAGNDRIRKVLAVWVDEVLRRRVPVRLADVAGSAGRIGHAGRSVAGRARHAVARMRRRPDPRVERSAGI